MSQSLPRNLQRDHKVTQNNGAGGERCCEKGYGKVEAWGNRWSRASCWILHFPSSWPQKH